MNNNQLITINQNSKQALIKSKNLLDITKKILNKEEIIIKFEFKPFLIEKKEHSSSVNSILISPDGKYIVSCSIVDKTIKIWDIKTGEHLKTLEGHLDLITTIVISPDGKYIVSGSWNDIIKIWDVENGKCLNTLIGDAKGINLIKISPNKNFIVSASSRNKIIKIWDIKTGESLKILQGHLDWITTIAISPDGKYIVSGSDDNTVKIWDIQNGKCLNTLTEHSWRVKSVAICPNSKYIVSGGNDNTIKIWDITTGKCLNTIKSISSWINSISISPDGKYIISGAGDRKIQIIDLLSAKDINTLSVTGDVNSITIDLDKKYIITEYLKRDTNNYDIKILDIESCKCLKILKGHKNLVQYVIISSDSKYIVSGSNDKTIKIWDYNTGNCIYTIDNDCNISIDNNGYFRGNDENIDKYLRVSEEPLTQRKLTLEEINHFRKKDSFLE